MAINFKARVLLELGAELISSDAVAIYELVKNALDAGSKRVEIDIDIALQSSAYSQLEESLIYVINSHDGIADFDAGKFNSLVESCIESDATEEATSRFARAYGVPSNAHEALRGLRAAYCEASTIVIRDQGTGMSVEALDSCYLTVGTPGRLLEKNAMIRQVDRADVNDDQKQPQKLPLGEKGIGRLSAMRLGHLINVKSKLVGEKNWNWLELDWRPAFLNPNLDASDLNFEPYQQRCAETEWGEKGTAIFISDLQGDWSSEK